MTRMLPVFLLLVLAPPMVGRAAAQQANASFTAGPTSSPAPGAGGSHPADATALTPGQAQQVLDVLRDDSRRAQFMSVLESLSKALPAAAPRPGAAPVVTAAPAAAPAAKLQIPLAPNSLGAEILLGASERLSHLSAQLTDTVRAITDFPLLSRWVVKLASDPDSRAEIIETAWKLLVLMAAAIGVSLLAARLLRGFTIALVAMAPEPGSGSARGLDGGGDDDRAPGERRRRPSALTLLRRLPFVLGRFLLDLLPVLAAAAAGYALLGTQLGVPSTTRLVILAVLNAYLLCRVVVVVTRLLVSPNSSKLRLVHLSDDAAQYVVRWVRRIALIAIFGYAAAEVALLFGLYRVAHDALLKLVSLAVHFAVIVVVLQKRGPIADVIAGRREASGPVAAVRRRVAALWHIVAIFFLIALWLVWAFEVQDGFARLIRVSVSTIIIGIVARLLTVAALGALDRTLRVDAALAARYPGLDARAKRYHSIARATISGLIMALALLVLFEAWGIDSLVWFSEGALGGRVISALLTIAVTLFAALLAWELANTAVQRELARLARQSQAARVARLRTLLPMFRSTLLTAIILFAGLTILSEVGVNIAPLLAGAGVLGIAIGFGSQKLVQDVITGLFLLLENTMQVGDVVTLGGLTGSVENLSIRTIRLRALDGSVHIVPFSAVTTVTNMTRDYGYVILDLNVGLNENPEHIADLVRDVVRTMQDESRWSSSIRDDVEILGVEKFVDLAFVLRARVMTLPGQRWAVARELNQRIKQRFDELAIESPITSFRALSHDPVVVPATRVPAVEGAG